MATEPATILIVDDEPMIRNALCKLCSDMGVDTREAENGAEALEMIAAGSIDLVLLDLMLPRVNGFDVLRRMRETSSGVPAVVVLTSSTEPQVQMQAIDLGALDYVTKPFRVPDLRRRIQRALAIVQLERRLDQAEVSLRQLRATDQTTGVEATSQLYRVLEAEFNAARVGERPLACVVVSDENYSQTLAQKGRGAGEQRLQVVATLIEERLRGADRVFRVDAAEFVILLPGTHRDGARRVVDKILETVADAGGVAQEDLAIAVAAYPHPELTQASLLYRAVNLTLARSRSQRGPSYFEGF